MSKIASSLGETLAGIALIGIVILLIVYLPWSTLFWIAGALVIAGLVLSRIGGGSGT